MQRAATLAGYFDYIPRRDGSMYVLRYTESNLMKIYECTPEVLFLTFGVQFIVIRKDRDKCMPEEWLYQ